MNDLLAFMYVCLLVFSIAWVVQIGAEPESLRTTLSAIVMTGAIITLIGCVALTLLNLILSVWL